VDFEFDGSDMRFSHNLKEIIWDDLVFCRNPLNEQEIFYFYGEALERVSIRNAKWYHRDDEGNHLNLLPQDSLIKFVRNFPPSMRWFRSDFTLDNMTMLRLERPEIELLN
jgi:hypothetical protein